MSNEKAIKEATDYYQSHLETIIKPYVVVDMTKPSNQKRMLLLAPDGKIIKSYYVAHGVNSSKESNRAYANKFSNSPGSHMSSKGPMYTAETYTGKHGYSCRLKGVTKDNDNVYRRNIVIHAAEYVTEDYIKKNKRAGQSHGCLAMDPALCKEFIQTVKGGVLIYVYA